MNDNSSGGKISFDKFHSVIVKGTWARLEGKYSGPRAKSPQYLGYHENSLFVLS